MPTRGEPEDSVELSARLPTRSLSGATEESTDALRLIMYLEEVREQALISSRAFARAWRAALTPDYDNDAVWADLQAMLFAGVVIQRILLPDPSSIRPKAGRSRRSAGPGPRSVVASSGSCSTSMRRTSGPSRWRWSGTRWST